MRKPSAPKKPDYIKPNADEKAKARMQEEMTKFADDQKIFEEAIAKWNAEDGDKKQFELNSSLAPGTSPSRQPSLR